MDNTRYLALPIKSLNSVVKFELDKQIDNFNLESVGCYYEGVYFDFKVTKLMSDYSLCEDLGQNNYINIHVNQINIEQPLVLCILFKSSIKCFVLDEAYYNKIQSTLSYQHKGNYFQLHLEYKNIKDNCECIINLQ